MNVLWYSIFGNSLHISANHPILVDAAKFLFRYVPIIPSRDVATLKLSLWAVPSRSDIPFVLSPEATCLNSPLPESGLETGEALYQDQGRLILDCLGRRGYYLVADQQKGIADLYVVGLDTMPAESLMYWIHLSLRHILKGKGFFTLHATALEKDGRAVLIPGMSGRGKTTAFLSLLRAGYRCVSDDHPLIHENGNGLEILPFQEKIDVTDNTIEFFPELQGAGPSIHSGTWKRYFFIEDVYSEGLGASSRPGLILFPEIVHRHTSTLEAISGKQALDCLIRESFLPRGNDIAKQEFHVLSRLVNQSSCYRLLFGKDVLDLPKLIDPLLAMG